MIEGIVTKATGNIYTVRINKNMQVNCVIKGNLRIKGFKATNPVSVGDKVKIIIPADSDKGLILEIIERKNYIIRKSINLSKQYHIIAANVDQALLIVTLAEPQTSTEFIDRYLVICEAFRIPCVIVFNKIDLYQDTLKEKFIELYDIYSKIGYTCIATSVTQNINLDYFKQHILNKISVLSGHSGVGKSSLINAIVPELNIKIGDISDYHKTGMHTTSFSQMYEIFENSFIIDTPGIKGFGLVDIEKCELYHFFPEIFKVSTGCKFNNCTHIHEPACAVVESVKSGNIAVSRYNSYLNMYFDENEKYRYTF